MFSISHSVFYLLVIGVLGVHSAFDLIEGEPCKTEGVAGKCVLIHRCLSAFVDLKNGKRPEICSFKGNDPVVCCIDCKLVEDTRKAIVANDGAVFFRSGSKAKDKCFEYLSYLPDNCTTNGLTSSWNSNNQCRRYEADRISDGYKDSGVVDGVVVGGRDAQRHNYTHMALLGYGPDRDSAKWLCGGSLISEKFVLTAAHCISEVNLGPVRYIAFGILKRSDSDELWHEYEVERIIPHPEYRSPSKYHDIALLETDKPVTFSRDVLPACLDATGHIKKIFYGYDDDKDGDDVDDEASDEEAKLAFQKFLAILEEPSEEQSLAIATGWGSLGKNRPLADNLQEVELGRFSEEECLERFPPHRLLKQGYNASTQMCYGDQNEPKDTCEGDSGGPLQVKSAKSNCLYTLIGVTSYGRSCGRLGDAGMYTRVFHYVPWIESVVWPEPNNIEVDDSDASPKPRRSPYISANVTRELKRVINYTNEAINSGYSITIHHQQFVFYLFIIIFQNTSILIL